MTKLSYSNTELQITAVANVSMSQAQAISQNSLPLLPTDVAKIVLLRGLRANG